MTTEGNPYNFEGLASRAWQEGHDSRDADVARMRVLLGEKDAAIAELVEALELATFRLQAAMGL